MPALAPIAENPRHGARSPKWPAVRAKFLKGKRCLACGRKANLNAHHVRPFHLFPALELDPANLVPLCEGGPWNCHFLAGHGGRSWDVYRPDPLAAVAEFRAFLAAARAAAVKA